MSMELWRQVDDYVAQRLTPPDAVLEAALARSEEAGLPSIQVTPGQGKFLHVLARACGAQTILEIGTLGAYSTIWLARALPPTGRLISLESNAKHVDVARRNLSDAGLAELVEVRRGAALDSLAKLSAEGAGPFDLVFIDADKQHSADYFEQVLPLCRLGALIVVDNVVRGGDLADPRTEDAITQGAQRLHDYLASERRATATTLQTVGGKGYDGMLLAVVTET